MRRFWLVGYRILLRFYPRGLRERYAQELEECFLEQYGFERERRGVRGAVTFVARTYWDVPFSVLRMRKSGGREVRRREGRAMPFVERLRFEVRHAFRGLSRSPGLVLLAAVLIDSFSRRRRQSSGIA